MKATAADGSLSRRVFRPSREQLKIACMQRWLNGASCHRRSALKQGSVYLETAKLDAQSKRERWEAYKKMEPGQRQPTQAASNEIEVVHQYR